MKTSNSWITAGAVLAGLAVAAGAFGAHGLDRRFAEQYANASVRSIGGMQVPASFKALEDFNTAARYQMYHALALIVVGLLIARGSKRSLTIAAWLFLGGIVLFSGGLYLYTLTGARFWGIGPPPIGGACMIAGWIALAIGACSCGGAPTDGH